MRISCCQLVVPISCPCSCRLQQHWVLQKQQAKEKLHKLVAPLLLMHDPDHLTFKAFGAIRPKLNVSFDSVGVTLRDGTVILQGVTGHFDHSKVNFCVAPGTTG